MMASRVNYSLHDFEGFNILDLSGDLTIHTSDAFISVVHNLTERGSLIMNMKNVNFVTSSGLNALIDVSYYARERGNRVVIMSPNLDVIDLIEYADFFSHLIFAESPEEGKTKIEHYT
jgi:anti-anti-sigma factor